MCPQPVSQTTADLTDKDLRPHSCLINHQVQRPCVSMHQTVSLV